MSTESEFLTSVMAGDNDKARELAASMSPTELRSLATAMRTGYLMLNSEIDVQEGREAWDSKALG